MIKGNESISI